MKTRTLLPKSICCLGLLLLSVTAQPAPVVYAADSCLDFIPLLIEATSEEVCREINMNWACYGQDAVDASPTGLRFAGPADREPLAVFQGIDPKLEQGMVLLRVQATRQQAPLNLLVLGDQGMKALGAATFEAAAQSNNLLCSDTPSGIVVQTAEGRKGAVKINQVEIILGSTAFIMVDQTDQMTVINIEGQVAVAIAGGAPQVIPEGAQMRIPSSSDPSRVIGPEETVVDESPVLQFIAKDPRGLRRVGDPNTNDPSPEARVPSCGGTINFGETLSQEIYTRGQECLFTFTVDRDKAATINLVATDSNRADRLDPWVDVRDPDLERIATNNDTTRDEVNSRICNLPLEASPRVYTIVARAAGNDSQGRFTLTLAEETDCAPPEPRCTLRIPALNLRSGPAVNYAVIRTLAREARLRPAGRNATGDWLYVEDLADGQAGWVSASPIYLTCEEGFTPRVTATPTPPTGTPTPPTGVVPTINPTTATPPGGCPPTALQARYGLPPNDRADCNEIPEEGSPPELPPPTGTPPPKPAPKDAPVPGP